MPAKVSVSIVSYNKKELLAECVAAVLAQDYPAIGIAVVDNASEDGTAELIRERFPQITLIGNRENMLFCRAQNQGIRAGGGEYVLALNNDVVLAPDYVSQAVKAMEADPRIGTVSGKVFRMDGVRIDTAGLLLGHDRTPVERGYGQPDRGLYDAPEYIFGAGGACPLYRRAMLDDIAIDGEYFDETYGAFYEDLDLAWRAHSRGWLAYYTPEATAKHYRGATAKAGGAPRFFAGQDFAWLSDRLKALLVSNRYFTMIKNDSPGAFLRDLPHILLYDIKLWAYIALFSPGVIPRFIGRLPGLKTAWRRRRAIRKKTKCT